MRGLRRKLVRVIDLSDVALLAIIFASLHLVFRGWVDHHSLVLNLFCFLKEFSLLGTDVGSSREIAKVSRLLRSLGKRAA